MKQSLIKFTLNERRHFDRLILNVPPFNSEYYSYFELPKFLINNLFPILSNTSVKKKKKEKKTFKQHIFRETVPLLTYLDTMTKEVATMSKVADRQYFDGTGDGSKGEDA